MRRSLIAIAVTLGLLAAACSGGSTAGSIPGPVSGPGVLAAPALQPFGSCEAFLDYVKRHAADLIGPWGLQGYGDAGYVVEDRVAFAEDGAVPRAPAPTMAPAGTVEAFDHSGTNVQVAGVDEPDLVKTDGERIFVVAGGRLWWIDASETPEVVASLTIEGWGQQLFLWGDRLLVMTSAETPPPEPLLAPGSRGVVPWYAPRTVLTEVDVSEPAAMAVVRTLTLDGELLASRMTDGIIRVVVRSEPTGLPWVHPEGVGIRVEREATRENARLLAGSTLENWVPWYVLEDHRSNTTSEGPLLGCDEVAHPREFSGLAMLTILTIDLTLGIEPGNGIGLLAEGRTVYASAESLYVATAPWTWRPWSETERRRPPETPLTQIHMFDVTDPTTSRYVASGTVEGTLLSQWSMDEWNGTLRVVVTDERPWWESGDPADTSVVTLRRRDDRLVQVGSVDGLGKDERVYAVRFIEDRGYVVTFRQVDPLYVVDLSDPTAPKQAGELKIEGYSAYLHPIGEHLLLGVGQDATGEGRTLGTQISVFDVSDATEPRRLARLTFEDAWSEAEWEAHAFLWWAPRGVAVLPLQRWSWDERSAEEEFSAGAVIVSASAQRVKQLGEIRHPQAAGRRCADGPGLAPPIVRALVIGETLYTVSESGVLASDLDTLDTIAWVPFG